MENKDNNIVVNAKPNTILLQSTEDEVTGGYYDADEVWHEFGGESDFVNVTISVTETSTMNGIQLLQVLNDLPDEFQSVGDKFIYTGESLNLRVVKNAFVAELYDGGTYWLKLVGGTGKTVDLGSDGVFLYFDEDGQTAVLDYLQD